MEDKELENTKTEEKKGKLSNTISKKTNQLGKKATKKATEKIAKKAAVKGTAMAAAGPVIFWGTIAILVLIIIIGIIMFFITMPGMAMSKIKELAKAFANEWFSWWGADSTQMVEEKQIYDSLNYLEEMGYDLKAFGFLTDYVGEEEDGVKRDDDGKITEAKSDFVKTYLASDNYIYTIKNHNLSTNAWIAFWQHAVNFFGGSFSDKLTRGLIAIYNEGDSFGERGSFYTDTSLFNGDELKLDLENRKIIFKRGYGGRQLAYDLDGWTGRYGMPVDFLLSVHFATMMPDLAYNMANYFDTEIIMLLNRRDYQKRIVTIGKSNSEDGTTRIISDTNENSDFGDIELNDGEEILNTEHEKISEYLPYLESVQNHWYRDVYFIINSANSKDKNINFIRNDLDYEVQMKERWTLYKTNEDGSFKLYALNSNGEYATSVDEIENYDSELFEPEEEYFLFKGSEEEQKRILQGKDTEGIRYNVAKMPEKVNMTDTDELEDLGWNKIKTVWTAYKSDDKNKDKVKIMNDVIVQEGEALRTETNAAIKKMFLTNTYFRYDGTTQKADIITALRKKIKTELESSGDEYGALNEIAYRIEKDGDGNTKRYTRDYTEKVYTVDELGLNDVVTDKSEINVKDYSGQVTLSQDSLNAFSMLENTHTLDADYIYRDFKELIVELGYFSKEELKDEVPRMLAFPIPQMGSAGYPDRSLDKRENEYGTLIHSRGDLDANERYTLLQLLEELEEIVPSSDEGTGTTDTEILVDETDTQIDIDPSTLGGGDKNDNEEIKKRTNEMQSVVVTQGEKENFESYIHVRQTATKVPSQVTLTHYLKACREMCEYMDEVGYDYCVNRDCEHDGCNVRGCKVHCCTLPECKDMPATKPGYRNMFEQHNKEGHAAEDYSCCCADFQCDHKVLGNYHGSEKGGGEWCGLRTSFPKSQEREWTRNVYCYLLVVWSMQNVGCLGENETSLKFNEWGGVVIKKGEELKPGDILLYPRHVDIYAGISTISGKHIKFNGGHAVQINAEHESPGSAIDTIASEDGWPDNAEYAIRLPWADTFEGPYEGYNGNEAVVSPVTGILLEYGTYDTTDIDTILQAEYRVNVDLRYGPLVQSEDFESKIISDKVGYAKILVLNTEYYQNLEQSTNNRWNERNGGESLVNKNGIYREELVDDDTLAEEKLSSRDDNIRWPEIDQTIYGYKEFAELYERTGVAGYVVFIDGFICEKQDTTLTLKKEVAQKIPYENDDARRAENTFYFDDEHKVAGGIDLRKVTPENFEDEQLDSIYIEEEEYKLISKKSTDKLIAENDVKAEASSSLYLSSNVSLNGEELLYIKEGTVLGRTMTDKELLESGRIRSEFTGTYEDNRLFSTKTNTDEKDKIIGNYVRIIMRDLDGTPVENVETYMKLDEIEENEDDILFMAGVITAEAGGEGDGAKACAWVIKNRVASDDFPNTLAEVLVAPGQFTVVNTDPAKCSGWIYQGELISIVVNGVKYYVSKPTDEAIKIAKAVWKDGAYPEINKKLDGRLYWKSKDTGVNKPGAIQIPSGTGNWFHY